jgi:asparagine N-glycosylation enzyme membrane subunit Stt3
MRDQIALFLVLLLAFGVRCLGAEMVFVDDETVVFYIGDPYFHVYRALASLEHLPWFLSFDLYTNYPYGAIIPAAPLYDLLIATTTRVLQGDRATLDVVAAWMPAVLGALSVLPVAAAGRVVGGRGVGLGAAALVALWPAAVGYSLVGYADHHAALGLLGASFLALQLRALDPTRSPVGVLVFVGLMLTRAALILTWSGSLLYVGLGDGVFVLVAAAWGRKDLLFGEALGALLGGLIALPFVASVPLPADGTFSAVQLSFLHVLACVGLAVWSGGVALRLSLAAETRRPGMLRLIVETLVLGLVVALVSLIASGALDELLVGLRFVDKGDGWGTTVLEQTPLYASRPGAPGGLGQFGAFVWLIPLAPFVPLLLARDAAKRPVAAVLFGWGSVLTLLVILQVRFANEFATVGAVLFSLGLARGAAWSAARVDVGTRMAAACAWGLGALLLLPALWLFYAPFFAAMPITLSTSSPPADRALLTIHGTGLRFAHEIRRVTPKTAGFMHANGAPEYCVLANPNLGHMLQYAAERPTAVNNFGPYIGRENVAAVTRFFGRVSEVEAVEIAEGLGCHYVVTNLGGNDDPLTFLNRLHVDDGRALAEHSPLSRFRLVTEGPAGGVPLAALYRSIPDDRSIPFKLFELVPGALLEIEATPDARIFVELSVRTPLRRTFTWSADVQADEAGLAQLRVPYATHTRLPTRPDGPYRIQVGDEMRHAQVSDRDVRNGLTVRVEQAVPEDAWR